MGRCIDATLSKDMNGPVKLHRFRYRLGRGFVESKDIVLDIGSGSGYGTEILSRIAQKVIGIEISKADVIEAQKKYNKPNVEFICDNLETMVLPSCDVVCAFEVLEHLYNVVPFIKKLKEVTKKFIVLSVPLGQELIWTEEAKEFQERGDHTHHAVFPNEIFMRELFVDDKWKEFYWFISGVTYLGVFYNTDAIIKKEDGTYDFI